MIRVFIGSHKKFERCEPVIEYSIRKYASEPVDIKFLRPEYYGCEDAGCTGFSLMRWEIPRICNYEGHAIYLDVDMILLADIADLWAYKSTNHVILKDSSTEVMVLNCAKSRECPKLEILLEHWNVEDWKAEPKDLETAKLIHFTDLKNQPWFYDHPKPWLSQIWFDMEREALEANSK
ncbi:MAG: hypothetical protein ACN2B6_00655 [Rickettsiales bacterium]